MTVKLHDGVNNLVSFQAGLLNTGLLRSVPMTLSGKYQVNTRIDPLVRNEKRKEVDDPQLKENLVSVERVAQ